MQWLCIHMDLLHADYLTAQQEGTAPAICIRSHLFIHCSCPTCHSASWCIMCVWVNVSLSAVLSALCRVSVLMCLWMCLTFPFCLSLAHSFARCGAVCWSEAVYLAEFALISCTTGGYWIPNCCRVMWRTAWGANLCIHVERISADFERRSWWILNMKELIRSEVRFWLCSHCTQFWFVIKPDL